MAYGRIAAIGEMTTADGVTFDNGNPCAFMDLNNVIYFCDDITVNGIDTGGTILTLPDEGMHPSIETVLSIPTETDSGDMAISFLTVDTTGNIKILGTPATTYHLAGYSFHINSRYYNPEIGNIYNNGTSPLTEGGW